MSKLDAVSVPLALFVRSTARSVHRVKGTAVFLSSAKDGVPAALLHNLKHNQVLHENVILLTVAVAEMPRIGAEDRLEHAEIGCGFHRIVLHYGFMDEVDIPRDLASASSLGIAIEPMRTSYFLGREKLIAAKEVAGMALWRERLFAWMLQASESAMDYYRLPANRVVELGSQLRI
ncbi:KUP/HAK/KT family potassium transporter [Novosphingobium sp. APW14]|uniref:KUP/HAK/KT family potassium transporter n=1 Tax=Novosphingobium sp. APW14 TaxID=3077237 RepID=UPI0028DE6366|nr:KUP/HAK/KT family potassium transporter [Novosphingobium sp. APW14]MDT9012763.1 KUP/HAK/KT family potassium transporter [Novosphingobium sp. APW14]